MTLAKLLQVFQASELADHIGWLARYARPAIDILRTAAPPAPGASRFGGVPEMPAGTTWPQHQFGPYRFIGQIRLADLTPCEAAAALPADGLLSLFVADDPDGNNFWQDPDYVRAFYWPAGTVLAPATAPEGAMLSPPVALQFRPIFDLPYDCEQALDWPFDEEQAEICAELRRSLHAGPDYLFGYPSPCSLAYDPTPSPDWVSLLTLDSDEQLEWCWHDGDRLMVFIERSQLAGHDFSVLRADAG